MKNANIKEVEITYKELFPLYKVFGQFKDDERLQKVGKKNLKKLKPWVASYSDKYEDLELKWATENTAGFIARNKDGKFDMDKKNMEGFIQDVRELDNTSITPELHIMPILKLFKGLQSNLLLILDPVLPEGFEDSVSALFTESEKEVEA